MAFTLADAKQLSQDKLTKYVIDEFRTNPLLDLLPFDDTVKPQGGASLSYVYNRIKTQPTAAGREINTEYVHQETNTKQVVATLKPFGGSFELDRVLQMDETQVVNYMQFQMQQKIKATRALFAEWFINGDSAGSDTKSFDGLDKAIKSSSTDKTAASLDLSTAAMVEKNWKEFLYQLRQVRKLMDGTPNIMAVNADMFAVFQSVADLSTQFTQTKNDLGAEIVKWGNTTIIDMGDKQGTGGSIIPTTEGGETDIYFIRTGMDGVHGITPSGVKAPTAYLPPASAMKEPGAVKKGEVEMVAGMALKATRAAAVLRKIKVVPGA